MKKGALSSTFKRDVCPIRQITPWEDSGSHLKAAPKRMSILMRTKFGSHLEKSLSARFPLVVDNNRRYASRPTTRKKATRQAVCCELGFLIRADWEKLAGSHPDSHIADICPRRRVFKEKRARGPLSPCDPGQGRNTLQPVAAVGGVFDDGVRLHERNQDAVAARLEEARREEHWIRLGSYGDHAACDEERHRHQEQVKRRGWQAQARNAAGDGRGWHEARQA